ncbi:MAG: sigma-54 dependent transcriptional regulator [Paracoccaceae bacterium]
MASPILLVEDTLSLAMLYKTVLEKAGHEVVTASTLQDARELWRKTKAGTVLLDLMLPDGDGMELMEEVHRHDANARVIVITANGSINRAVEAMRLGAFDFLVKPFDENRLLRAVENALSAKQAQRSGTRELPQSADGFHGFLGNSPEMQAIYRMIDRIGRSTASVFITGESGTGKELAAHAIHDCSPRANGPFIALNCGAIPRDLLESEVFGHLKGSFTGAISDKKGAAAAAHGGTLFLDEICEMDLSLQTKLLRFLQTSSVTPVGAVTPREVDVRIVCATNRDPMVEMRAGRFREDLYYRLHVVPIHLPPLRERRDDILKIAELTLHKYAQEEGKMFRRLNPETAQVFRRLDWPGNVRQLLNVLRNVVVLNDGVEMMPEMLPHDILLDARRMMSPGAPEQPAARSDAAPNISAFVGHTLAEMERAFIEATIEASGGSLPQAARILGVSPSTLYRKREGWT